MNQKEINSLALAYIGHLCQAQAADRAIGGYALEEIRDAFWLGLSDDFGAEDISDWLFKRDSGAIPYDDCIAIRDASRAILGF